MLEERADYGVTMMARVLGASRSGLCRWLRANPEGSDPWAEPRDAMLEVWVAGRRHFGFRKARAKLEGDPRYHGRFGGVTRHRVRECMLEPGIRGICPNAPEKTAVPDEDAPRRGDLIRRGFESPVPTTRPAGDITCLRTAAGFICPAAVVGLATRMAVGWAVADSMRAQLVVSAMEMAWSRGYVAGNAISRSDRGSQYTSSLFAAWAKAHDVRLSVGRTGSCHDNAVAGSFFGTLKNEWAHRERLTDAETAKFGTIEFIESYYSRYRPHEAIGDRVPAEAMAEFFERFGEAMSYEPELPLAA